MREGGAGDPGLLGRLAAGPLGDPELDEPQRLRGHGAAVHAPQETAGVQVGQVAADGLGGHPVVLGGLRDRDPALAAGLRDK